MTVVFFEIVNVVVGLSTPFGVVAPAVLDSVAVKTKGLPLGSKTSRGMYTGFPALSFDSSIKGTME